MNYFDKKLEHFAAGIRYNWHKHPVRSVFNTFSHMVVSPVCLWAINHYCSALINEPSFGNVVVGVPVIILSLGLLRQTIMETLGVAKTGRDNPEYQADRLKSKSLKYVQIITPAGKTIHVRRKEILNPAIH